MNTAKACQATHEGSQEDVRATWALLSSQWLITMCGSLYLTCHIHLRLHPGASLTKQGVADSGAAQSTMCRTGRAPLGTAASLMPFWTSSF